MYLYGSRCSIGDSVLYLFLGLEMSNDLGEDKLWVNLLNLKKKYAELLHIDLWRNLQTVQYIQNHHCQFSTTEWSVVLTFITSDSSHFVLSLWV